MLDERTELCEMALRYGTDKAGHHEYTRVYHELLNNRRISVKKVLEIGIGHPGCMWPGYRVGASLYMWQEYFPSAHIYALDIEPSIQIYDNRISTIYADQSSRESLLNAMHRVSPSVDLIVDDGSHVAQHQIISAQTLIPFLSKDGIYVIEDVHVPAEEIIRQLPSEGFTYEVIECPGKLVCECGCGGPEKLVVIRRA